MKNSDIRNAINKQKKKVPLSNYGMHPGGGFVAWPDGSTRTATGRFRIIHGMRGSRRKGFVAWPENKQDSTTNCLYYP